MSVLSRREFTRRLSMGSAAAGLWVTGVTKVLANPLGLPIGSQIWPTRSMLKDSLLKYPGRFFSMHLQDVYMSGSPRTGADGGQRRMNHPQVALGEGSIDWVKTFKAAKVGGVKNYFVEQSWELTHRSVAYLKTLEV